MAVNLYDVFFGKRIWSFHNGYHNFINNIVTGINKTVMNGMRRKGQKFSFTVLGSVYLINYFNGIVSAASYNSDSAFAYSIKQGASSEPLKTPF